MCTLICVFIWKNYLLFILIIIFYIVREMIKLFKQKNGHLTTNGDNKLALRQLHYINTTTAVVNKTLL